MSAGRPVAVIGAGSWGVALAYLLAQRGREVRLWARSGDVAASINREHACLKYLPQAELPDSIVATSDHAAAIRGAEIVVIAVPCVGVREIAELVCDVLTPDMVLVSGTKGLAAGSGLRPSQQMLKVWGERHADRVVVLSGPNLAAEVVQGIPTTSVAAGVGAAAAAVVQEAFSTPTFRVYTNPDVAGVELGGALKNIIAIGAGINDGLGFGDNTKASLCTRGLAEIIRLGVALGARPATFYGLSGMGDLLATCASQKSRNRTVGYRIARGETLQQVLSTMTMVAEGVNTTACAMGLAERHGVDMPITAAIHGILFDNRPVATTVTELMCRESKAEFPESD